MMKMKKKKKLREMELLGVKLNENDGLNGNSKFKQQNNVNPNIQQDNNRLPIVNVGNQDAVKIALVLNHNEPNELRDNFVNAADQNKPEEVKAIVEVENSSITEVMSVPVVTDQQKQEKEKAQEEVKEFDANSARDQIELSMKHDNLFSLFTSEEDGKVREHVIAELERKQKGKHIANQELQDLQV